MPHRLSTRISLFTATIVAVTTIINVTTASAQVTGVVSDPSLVPLEGAIVSVQATGLRTVTAADGSFSLPGATGTDIVIVAALKG